MNASITNPHLANVKIAGEGTAKLPATVEVDEEGNVTMSFNALDVLQNARPSASGKDTGVFLTVPSIDIALEGGAVYRLALGQGGGWLSTRKAR
jgi:hypothetical protein